MRDILNRFVHINQIFLVTNTVIEFDFNSPGVIRFGRRHYCIFDLIF